jgi:asparaginyl-tRNA synthetase
MPNGCLKELILINSAMSRAFRDHYENAGLTHVEVPQIVGVTGACENVDTLFRVGNRLGCPLYFSQTGQLCLEQALMHFPGVWTSMHSGRDEELEDARHLRQFLLTEEEFDWSMAGGEGRVYD